MAGRNQGHKTKINTLVTFFVAVTEFTTQETLGSGGLFGLPSLWTQSIMVEKAEQLGQLYP